MSKNITKTVKVTNVKAIALDDTKTSVINAFEFAVIGGISERKALKQAQARNSAVVAVELSNIERRYTMPLEEFIKVAQPTEQPTN